MTKVEDGPASDKEARELIARTLATESAQAAGFGLALPLAEEFRGRLVVFAPAENPELPMQARFVRVQWVGVEEGPVVLCPELDLGELLVLVDWSGANHDVPFLLTHEQVQKTWTDPKWPGGRDPHRWKFGGWCRAIPERWRELVLGGETGMVG